MTYPSTEHPVERAFREFAEENKCNEFSMSRKDHLKPPAAGEDPETPPHLWVTGEYSLDGRMYFFKAELYVDVEGPAGLVVISASIFHRLPPITDLRTLCEVLRKSEGYGVDISEFPAEGEPPEIDLFGISTEITAVNFTNSTVFDTSVNLDVTLGFLEEWLEDADDAEPPPRF